MPNSEGTYEITLVLPSVLNSTGLEQRPKVLRKFKREVIHMQHQAMAIFNKVSEYLCTLFKALCKSHSKHYACFAPRKMFYTEQAD